MQPTKDVIAKYVASLNQPAVAIFDIGTRAARLFVGPREIPARWDKHTFCNASTITNLGLGVDKINEQMSTNSDFFRQTISFIRRYLSWVHDAGVQEITMIGTAVFRWIQNEKQILDLISSRFGMELQIIPQEMEGRLTLLAVPEIMRRRSPHIKIGDDDTIMMVDQGGGSLEVSWVRAGDCSAGFPRIEKKEADNLGTVALRHEFFARDASMRIVPPETNKAQIAAQIRRIEELATASISSWRGMPKASGLEKRKLQVFAVGSAITSMWPKLGSYDVHGKKATIEGIARSLDAQCSQLGGSTQQVLSVYKAMMGIEGSGTKTWQDARKLDQDLAMLWGLPVYRAVLQACGMENLTVNGYALRYGYYIDRYLRLAVEPDDSGPYIFVSYSHINPHYVYEDMFRLHGNAYRIWYDRGIRPTTNWQTTLADRIDGCRAVLAFLTAEAIKSDPIYQELFAAKEAKKTIIPVLVGISEADVPTRLRMCMPGIQYLKKRNDDGYLIDLMGVLPKECKR